MELEKTIQKNLASLKLYLRFESGAELVDSSGNSHTLTAIGTPTYSAGEFGQAVDLATNKGFSIVDHADLKPTGAFSISAWVKTTFNSSDTYIFQSYSQNSNVAGFRLALANNSANVQLLSGKNNGTTLGTNWNAATGTKTVNDGNWHFVVATSDGTTLRVYVDGKFDSSSAWANNPAYAATNYVRIGCLNTSGSDSAFFSGSIDDLHLFNGIALSADQIKELYEGRYVGEGWPQTGLVAGYHLNGNSTDFSGNNNHGTDSNMTYGAGKIGNCGIFNGSSSYIATPTYNQASGADFTVSGWIMRTGACTNYNGIVSHSTSAADSWMISLYSGAGTDNKISFRGNDGYLTTPSELTINIWYHFACIFSSGIKIIYLNGAEVTRSGSTSYTGTNIAFVIGRFYTNSANFYLPGKLDEVQIYSVAKDANWVRDQFGLGMGKFY